MVSDTTRFRQIVEFEQRLSQCPLAKGAFTYGDESGPYLDYNSIKHLLKYGKHMKGSSKKSLGMTPHACHINTKECASKFPNQCIFYGYVLVDSDGIKVWQKHSWLVSKRGKVTETWIDPKMVLGYFGVADYVNSGVQRIDTCDMASATVLKRDKTKGCRLKPQ